MAFVPRLKVAECFGCWTTVLSGCCVSGFVELFGSRVNMFRHSLGNIAIGSYRLAGNVQWPDIPSAGMSRHQQRTPPQISDLQNPDFVQIVLLKYSELNWKILEATNCREAYPLTAHWTCIERSWELWQSPEATQSLDAQKGCHWRVMSVTSGGPKVVGPWDFLTIENSLIKIDQPIQRVPSGKLT